MRRRRERSASCDGNFKRGSRLPEKLDGRRGRGQVPRSARSAERSAPPDEPHVDRDPATRAREFLRGAPELHPRAAPSKCRDREQWPSAFLPGLPALVDRRVARRRRGSSRHTVRSTRQRAEVLPRIQNTTTRCARARARARPAEDFDGDVDGPRSPRVRWRRSSDGSSSRRRGSADLKELSEEVRVRGALRCARANAGRESDDQRRADAACMNKIERNGGLSPIEYREADEADARTRARR